MKSASIPLDHIDANARRDFYSMAVIASISMNAFLALVAISPNASIQRDRTIASVKIVPAAFS